MDIQTQIVYGIVLALLVVITCMLIVLQASVSNLARKMEPPAPANVVVNRLVERDSETGHLYDVAE